MAIEKQCDTAWCFQLAYLHVYKAGGYNLPSTMRILRISPGDLDGAAHLPSISLSSEANSYNSGINMAPLCLDKLALTIQNTLYCSTTQEFFPWIMLEYKEEVSHRYSAIKSVDYQSHLH